MSFTIHHGDALKVLASLPSESVQCCVTSPPYWGLRDYGVDGQLGLEKTPEEYVTRLVSVFREVRRVLKNDGVSWVNLGDSYCSGGRKTRDPGRSKLHPAFMGEDNQVASWRPDDPSGLKPKDLIGIPWRVAFALQADGWYLRQDIIWHKPNPIPESVRDRCTKAHEYVFMLTKRERYYYDADAIVEQSICVGDECHLRADNTQAAREFKQDQAGNRRYTGFNERYFGTRLKTGNPTKETRNKRSVWTLPTLPTPEAHFATYPIDLPELCISASTREGDTVIDPFSGAGTTGLACIKTGREYVGIELNAEYIGISHKRAGKYYPLMVQEEVIR